MKYIIATNKHKEYSINIANHIEPNITALLESVTPIIESDGSIIISHTMLGDECMTMGQRVQLDSENKIKTEVIEIEYDILMKVLDCE